jgi:hypothetical protein
MSDPLTPMERRAVAGMESLARDMAHRHALEAEAFRLDWNAMLAEIAASHGLPAECWSEGWAIDLGEWEIYNMRPAEEPTPIAPRAKRRKKALG